MESTAVPAGASPHLGDAVTVDRSRGRRADTTASTVRLPLPVLVSRVLGALTRELEAGGDAGDAEGRRTPAASLAVWSNVLRCVGDGLDEPDLAPRARISKRLAIAAVTGGARAGWLTAAGDKRGKRALSLTEAGRSSDEHWRALLTDADREWEGSPLRRALEALVSQLRFEHAWYPASYGTADPSVVGGSFVAAKPDTGEPAHGQDWRPVWRGEGATVLGVPITALLSQTLQAFAMDYEGRPAWPLASTTLVVQHLRTTPSPLADVPGEHGITGNGKSLLERHGIATVTTDRRDPRRRLVHLTELGDRVRASHMPALAAVEGDWRKHYGDDVVHALRSALEALPAAVDETLPEHVVAPLHLG